MTLYTENLSEEPSEQLREFKIFISDNQVVAEDEEIEEQLEGRRHRDRLQTFSYGPCINSSNSDGPPDESITPEVSVEERVADASNMQIIPYTRNHEPISKLRETTEENRKLLWSKVEKKRHVDKDALWVKVQTIKDLEPMKRGGVGGDLNIYTGVSTCIKEHASLKDDPT